MINMDNRLKDVNSGIGIFYYWFEYSENVGGKNMSVFKSRRILIIAVAILAGVGMVALLFSAGAGSALAKSNETAQNVRESALLPTLQTTPTAEYGPVCVNDYQPGSVCTANDVRVVDIQATDVITPCTGEGTLATAQYVFDVRAQAQGGSPNRYDIGIFVDLDGVSTGSGNSLEGGAQLSGATGLNNPDGVTRVNGCYHTFLGYNITSAPLYAEPPNDRSLVTGGVTTTVGDGVRDLWDGPWWDGSTDSPAEDDICGDIESGTQLFKTIDTLQFVCTDSDGDGNVDLSVCTSWDNQTGSYCALVSDTIPNTKSKCSCGFINFPFTPTGITLGEISASTTNRWLLPIVGILLILAVTTIVVLRKQTTAEQIV